MSAEQEHAAEARELRAEVERLKAKVESATDLLNARGMSCGPDTDITRLLRQRDAARAEAASAAEKQREASIKCATFNPGSIPADVRAKMDADRARDAAPRVEFARERCPLLDRCCILPTGHTTACTVGGPHYKRTR